MSIFNAKYLPDEEIWLRLDSFYTERSEVESQLGDPTISTDPERMPHLAKRLYELNQKCLLFDQLKGAAQDLKEINELIGQELPEEHELGPLHHEYARDCQELAGQVYILLMELGLLPEEIEDEKDLEILQFIDYAGPEYAWRLGINVGLDVEESRRRLENLLNKGLLEKVQGNMLAGYHRQKDWVKHMNHTYYRITREGRLYLRRLRREQEELNSSYK